MQAFYLVCAIAGATVLILQLVGAGLHEADASGADVHEASGGHEALSHGLHLFSVRAIAAGLAFFGTTGWFATRNGWSQLLALPAALLLGSAGLVAVAFALRQMGRLESDGTLQLANAIGLDGTVHLSIPEQQRGAGKVMLTVQGRLVELPAVTSGPALPTGAPVTVVDVRDDDVLEVRTATSILQDEV
ncbi:MAG TPA: hypothetical protein VEA99_21520 [Gemmatimonadaceae bacterium]|nr:hypothetical protein [Gemmatimonadaceae bacterium]